MDLLDLIERLLLLSLIVSFLFTVGVLARASGGATSVRRPGAGSLGGGVDVAHTLFLRGLRVV